jgi:hypothetical protein
VAALPLVTHTHQCLTPIQVEQASTAMQTTCHAAWPMTGAESGRLWIEPFLRIGFQPLWVALALFAPCRNDPSCDHVAHCLLTEPDAWQV